MIKIHRLLDGPFSNTDFVDYDGEEEVFFVEVLAEIDGEYRQIMICRDNFDDIYNIASWFTRPTIEPYILETEEKNWVNQ